MIKPIIISVAFLFVLNSCNENKKNEIEAETIPTETPLEILKVEEEPKIETTVTEKNNWEFDKIKKSKIYFKGGPSFETGLYELAYIDQIKSDNKPPFLIYSGRDCEECDAQISLYFHSPRNGELRVGHGQNRNAYPGKELDYITDSLLTETRVFYGEVLKGKTGMIWFQKFLLEQGGFGKGIYLSSIEGDTVHGREIKNYDQKLAETLALNKTGKNKEIKGIEYTSEP